MNNLPDELIVIIARYDWKAYVVLLTLNKKVNKAIGDINVINPWVYFTKLEEVDKKNIGWMASWRNENVKSWITDDGIEVYRCVNSFDATYVYVFGEKKYRFNKISCIDSEYKWRYIYAGFKLVDGEWRYWFWSDALDGVISKGEFWKIPRRFEK